MISNPQKKKRGMLHHFKVVELPDALISKKGSPYAYTMDDIIYVSERFSAMSTQLKKIVLKHEVAHILLLHRYRSIQFAKKKEGHLDHHKLMIAKELEVAIRVYTPEETGCVDEVLGGVTPISYPVPNGLRKFEDIYEYVPDNETPDQANPCCGSCRDLPSEGDGEQEQQNGSGSDSVPGHDGTPGPDGGGDSDSDEDDDEDLIDDTTAKGIEGVVNGLLTAGVESVEYNQQDPTAPGTITMNLVPKPTLFDRLDKIVHEFDTSYRNTYQTPSPKRHLYPDEYLLKHRTRVKVPKQLVVYIDRSGSFGPDKTAKVVDVVKMIEAKYKATINITYLYFGSGKLTDEDPGHGWGDTPYHLIRDSLVEIQPAMAIIVTDTDSTPRLKPDPRVRAKIYSIPVGTKSTDCPRMFGSKDIHAD